jgi:hypothetical protein
LAEMTAVLRISPIPQRDVYAVRLRFPKRTVRTAGGGCSFLIFVSNCFRPDIGKLADRLYGIVVRVPGC